MKNFSKTYLFALALLPVLFSCSKNTDNPIPTQTFSTLLDHVVELDTSKSSPNDTLSKRYFLYDASTRVVFDSFIQKLSYNPGFYYQTTETHYSGADTLAAWTTTHSWTTTTRPYIDTTRYTFSNGKYQKDSMNFDDRNNFQTATARNSYTYSTGKITRSFQNWIQNLNYSSTEFDTVHYTTINGNISYLIDSLSGYTNNISQVIQIFETNISYLPNPNPYYHPLSASAKPFSYTVGIGNQINSRTIPKQLISQQTSNMGNALYTYKFRSDGYPLSAILKSEFTGQPTTFTKLIFVYK